MSWTLFFQLLVLIPLTGASLSVVVERATKGKTINVTNNRT
jgi:hypothetical protein